MVIQLSHLFIYSFLTIAGPTSGNTAKDHPVLAGENLHIGKNLHIGNINGTSADEDIVLAAVEDYPLLAGELIIGKNLHIGSVNLKDHTDYAADDLMDNSIKLAEEDSILAALRDSCKLKDDVVKAIEDRVCHIDIKTKTDPKLATIERIGHAIAKTDPKLATIERIGHANEAAALDDNEVMLAEKELMGVKLAGDQQIGLAQADLGQTGLGQIASHSDKSAVVDERTTVAKTDNVMDNSIKLAADDYPLHSEIQGDDQAKLETGRSRVRLAVVDEHTTVAKTDNVVDNSIKLAADDLHLGSEIQGDDQASVGTGTVNVAHANESASLIETGKSRVRLATKITGRGPVQVI